MSSVYKTFSITIKALEAIHPDLAANFTFKIFQRTRKLPLKKREKVFYKQAQKSVLDSPYGKIPVFELGPKNAPLVLLVHGWESNAGCLAGVANILLKKGYRILTLDLPAHGHFKGNSTNLIQCKRALKWMLKHKVPKGTNFSVVSHSFGSAVAGFALAKNDYTVNQFVMLSTFNRIPQIFEDFKNLLDIPDGVYVRLMDKAAKLLSTKMDKLSVAQQLTDVSYQQLTIIHDVRDKVIPIAYAQEVVKAIPNIDFIELERVGHYRMLWAQKTYAHIQRIF